MDTPISHPYGTRSKTSHPYGTRSKTKAATNKGKGKERSRDYNDIVAPSPRKPKSSKPVTAFFKKNKTTSSSPMTQPLISGEESSSVGSTNVSPDVNPDPSGHDSQTDEVMAEADPTQPEITSTSNNSDNPSSENEDLPNLEEQNQSYTDSDDDDYMDKIQRNTAKLSLNESITQRGNEDTGTSVDSTSEGDSEMWAIYWKALMEHAEFDSEEWEIYLNAVKAHGEQQGEGKSASA
ncbi:hypothetical protein DFH27DRAFT_609930 [Peziza echinospora]|nr:hypothetical protein DFH27DRAFT_609930 [Peziza echinospora]